MVLSEEGGDVFFFSVLTSEKFRVSCGILLMVLYLLRFESDVDPSRLDLIWLKGPRKMEKILVKIVFRRNRKNKKDGLECLANDPWLVWFPWQSAVSLYVNTFCHIQGHMRTRGKFLVLEVQMSASAMSWLLLLRARRKKENRAKYISNKQKALYALLLARFYHKYFPWVLFPILGVTSGNTV